MLTGIRMDSVASFKEAVKLETDKKINLIYGLNGTGKSTISDFLYDPSDNHRFSHCKIYSEQTDPILVYNQTFIQDNFYTSDRLKGIFSLSKENKAAEEKIAKATDRLTQLEQRKQEKSNEKKKETDVFENQKQRAIDEVWKIKTTYTGGDRVLEYCLDGLKNQKDKLFKHLLSIAKPDNAPKNTVQEIRKEVEALKGETSQTQPTLPHLQFTANDVENNQIFRESIIGNKDSQVSELIDKLSNADWVKQGLDYLPEHINNDVQDCPFCQEKTITSNFIDSVRGYFDETYQKQIDSLERLQTEYIAAQDALLDIDTYTNNQFGTKRAAELTKYYQEFVELIRSNTSRIEQKIKTPKEPQFLKSSTAALTTFNSEVKDINKDIEEYNTRLKNRESALNSFKKEFWSIMRWQYDQTLSRFEDDRVSANERLKALEKKLLDIDSAIDTENNKILSAQKETVNIDEAIDAINKGLVDLGIDGFSITKHSDNLYRIVRPSESEDAFRTLSEGEKMMISFLYFCELCKGKASAEDTHPKRIVVIDDPISSLSHVFIFNVGQLIRSIFFRSDRFSQVFILTHSLYFFYEMTDNNHERRKDNQKLFRITKSSNGSAIEVMKYEEIQNDYQSYWSIINDSSQPPALIANCMRNIIEYFFNFVRKKDLNNVFQMPQLQEVKYQAFCRYVNRESHSLGQNIIDMKEFDYDTFKEGLMMVFDTTGYKDHFEAMSKI